MSDTRLIRYDIADPQAGGQRRPFAKAVRAGDYVHVSGQVPTVGGEVVAGGIVAQTEAVIGNIKAVLALAGCGLEDVIKVTCCWMIHAIFPVSTRFLKSIFSIIRQRVRQCRRA